MGVVDGNVFFLDAGALREGVTLLLVAGGDVLAGHVFGAVMT